MLRIPERTKILDVVEQEAKEIPNNVQETIQVDTQQPPVPTIEDYDHHI